MTIYCQRSERWVGSYVIIILSSKSNEANNRREYNGKDVLSSRYLLQSVESYIAHWQCPFYKAEIHSSLRRQVKVKIL